MSCDVLPTCEEGLGVEKACYPDEDAREGAPQAPCSSLTQAGRDPVPRPQKQTRKETKDMRPRGETCSHRNRTKIRAFFSPKVSIISVPWSCWHAGVTEEH